MCLHSLQVPVVDVKHDAGDAEGDSNRCETSGDPKQYFVHVHRGSDYDVGVRRRFPSCRNITTQLQYVF